MLAGKKVLLVGGDEAVFAEAARALAEAGAAPTLAPTGEAALELLEHEPFQLAIVDLRLTGMNAYDFCKRLEGHAQLDRLPIIASANNPFVNSINIATCRNVVDFLRKPFAVRDLVSAVADALSGKPGTLARTARFRRTG